MAHPTNRNWVSKKNSEKSGYELYLSHANNWCYKLLTIRWMGYQNVSMNDLGCNYQS